MIQFFGFLIIILSLIHCIEIDFIRWHTLMMRRLATHCFVQIVEYFKKFQKNLAAFGRVQREREIGERVHPIFQNLKGLSHLYSTSNTRQSAQEKARKIYIEKKFN